jgi:hypothetical protein
VSVVLLLVAVAILVALRGLERRRARRGA